MNSNQYFVFVSRLFLSAVAKLVSVRGGLRRQQTRHSNNASIFLLIKCSTNFVPEIRGPTKQRQKENAKRQQKKYYSTNEQET